jgi:hypothetical protein
MLGMLTGRIKMIVYAVAGASFLAMGAVIWWLYADNQDLAGETERLNQINSQLAESAESQKAVADTLQNELISRDELARRHIESRKTAESKLTQARQALHDALKDNQCASEPHPAAVGDWLRKPTDDL